MKTFQQISKELNEAKFKLPSGHKELKSEIVKQALLSIADLIPASHIEPPYLVTSSAIILS